MTTVSLLQGPGPGLFFGGYAPLKNEVTDNNNNLYFKRVTPITMKSILPSGPLKTKLIIINYSNHDKKPIYK